MKSLGYVKKNSAECLCMLVEGLPVLASQYS